MGFGGGGGVCGLCDGVGDMGWPGLVVRVIGGGVGVGVDEMKGRKMEREILRKRRSW